jgi:D-alanyl-lipoteichoic acid acyltransferase DltB (MBOAT superfamily)
MLFNSIAFLIFLPITFIIYWFVVNKTLKLQNFFILLASYVFYGSWDWRFLSLIIISSITDYLLGLKIHQSESSSKRKTYLIISLVINIGVLGFFKYYNFFVDSFIDLFELFGISLNPSTLSILLPVGISFYTFQTLSYTIDIYRKKLEPTNNIVAFFAFIAFFPQLVAGPIERAKDLLPQFLKERKFNYDQAISGIRMSIWGLFKKIVIADNLAKYVDVIYSSPEDFYGLSVIIGTVFFTFQLYCDFSGYSDIAIGISKLFGFKLMTNFKTPFFSSSTKEFWTRWHISLSTWFKDYLYIPLGGNKVSKWRWSFNLFFTFLISGFWHGANWTFIIWGALNGFYLVFAMHTETIRNKGNQLIGLTRVPKLLTFYQVFLTFSLYAFSLMIFRAQSWSDATTLISNIPRNISLQFSSISNFLEPFKILFETPLEFMYILLSFVLFITIDFIIRNKGIDGVLNKVPKLGRYFTYYFIIIWILIFGAFDMPQEFIYFQF